MHHVSPAYETSEVPKSLPTRKIFNKYPISQFLVCVRSNLFDKGRLVQSLVNMTKIVMETRQILQKIEASQARWLRIYWCDYTSSVRCRLIPISLIKEKLEKNEPVTVTITKYVLGLLPTDVPIAGTPATGGYYLVPDWTSLRSGPSQGQITCVGEFREKDGSEVMLCPRTVLRHSLAEAAKHGLEFILGFEIELTVMEHNPDESSPEKYISLRKVEDGWSMARRLADWGREGSFNSCLDEMADDLDRAEIGIEQLHIESAPGQYEVVLRPLPALHACDAYLFARQIIEATAARHGFRVTYHPKPFLNAPGNAAHVHMSISSPGGNEPQVYEPFYAGILKHLRPVTAFTYASPMSYGRMADSCWAGGRWIGWGSENRETPLRKCEEGHWEYRLLDGLANPYLALAAILSAGTAGFVEKLPLSTWKDTDKDPALMSSEQRQDMGITKQLPASLTEALKVLEANDPSSNLLHPSVVERQISTKKAEIAMLEAMGDEERRQWIIGRF